MSSDSEKLTPAQKQYTDMKKQHSDCILFFRMGDFYETFNEDAKIAAKVLDLTLTSRDRTSENPAPMAGVPFHSVDKYIARLVAHGYKVAIAEQMSEPKTGQIVERKVTQIITPATFIEESKKEFVYLAAITYTWGDMDSYHCAWWDVTVGSYYTRSFHTFEDLLWHLSRLQPREIVVDIDFPQNTEIRTYVTAQWTDILVSTYDKPVDVDRFLSWLFGVQTLSSYGKALEEGREYAMWLLLHYLQHIQEGVARSLLRIQYDSQTDDVMLDAVTIRNLEIITSQYESTKKYSLLGVIDQTSTALWARLMREILLHPTQHTETIQTRQAWISHYTDHLWEAKNIQEILRRMVDLPKIVSTLLYKKNNPMTFGKLRYALGLVHKDLWDRSWVGIDSTDGNSWSVGNSWSLGLKPLVSSQALEKTKEYFVYLESLLKVEWLNDDIDYIQDWYSAEIDELRKIAYHSDNLLLSYQQELVQATWITNVKVKYVSNQWYVLEVTPKDVDAFEARSIKGDPKREMIRRQTLKTGQRYTSIYLDELQRKVLSAQFQLRSSEQALLEDAKASLLAASAAFHELADGIAWLDLYTSHALFAKEKKYVKPEMTTTWSIQILGGRHPVIEAFLPHDQHFIPNDLLIGKRRDTGGMLGENWFIQSWTNATEISLSLTDGSQSATEISEQLATETEQLVREEDQSTIDSQKQSFREVSQEPGTAQSVIDRSQSQSQSQSTNNIKQQSFTEVSQQPSAEKSLSSNDQCNATIPGNMISENASPKNAIEDGSTPNDLENDDTTLAIITGPNMGGKSTYLRQNALIILMAHCWLFVPAQTAQISLVDGLFARVGSGDVIAKNQSTFMTEMIEMSNILHNATEKSFIILDELGRGTSTYDGMALAQAIVQYIVQYIGAKTLFATHYHELIELEKNLPWVKNYSVAVYETQKDVVFMKKIIPWWADKSYGIDVAKLAGIPSVITEAAKKYLRVYETKNSWNTSISQGDQNNEKMPDSMPLFAMSIDQESIEAKNTLEKIKRLLGSLDPNNITPMQALQMIARLKDDLEK